MAGKRDPMLERFEELIYGKKLDEIPELEPGISARRRLRPAPEPAPQPFVIEHGTEYAARYQKEDMEQVLANANNMENFQKERMKGPGMSMLEDDSTICGDLLGALDIETIQEKGKCFEEYDFTRPSERTPLAIDTKREEILSLLKKESAVVIKGFTGCGKTTQVPQFILDECYNAKTPCNIVVTQPRRIAAISIAARVCHERNWALGTVVGYVVGMERQTNPFTCLTYMTTGCLLESLVTKKSLEGYTHIIVDEVHERDEDTDLLLMIIRKFLFHTRHNVKVIMMSATADAAKFSKYFAKPVEGVLVNAPVVSVDVAETHPVRVYHLDDLENLSFLSIFTPKKDNNTLPQIEEKTYDLATRLIAALDEKREIMRFGRHTEYNNISSTRGAVLIFLPGLYEIETMHKALVNYDENCDNDKKNYWYILPLHSRVTSEEQRKVFQKPPKEFSYYRKIILATNIAESSLTVPDILYVVDFCLVKQLVTDPETNFCTLKMDWASKSSCIQRKGRVGRVNEGVVYRMVYREFYERVLPDDIPPEILRCPLEHTILRVKMLNLGAPKALLGLVIDPPNCENIVRTIFTLKEVGALFVTCNGQLTIEDGDLSYLGRVVARLPVEVHLGKLIMLGYIFNIFEEAVIMAAGLASKNIFSSPFQKKLLAYRVRVGWDKGAFSDPICMLNAYQQWKFMHVNEEFKRPGERAHEREKKWAEANYIELKALKDMDILVNELAQRLKHMGIESIGGPNVKPLKESQKTLLLRVIIYGAFYPNYFSRDSLSGRIDEKDAVKTLGGLCPFSSVRLQGFPTDHPPKAYLMQIKEHVQEILKTIKGETWNARIKLDAARVLIQFHQEGNLNQDSKVSRICLPVYLAVKQKQLDYKYILNLMDKRDAEVFSRKVEEDGKRLLGLSDTASVASSSFSTRSEVPRMLHIPDHRTPKFNEFAFEVTISHIETPDRFWCHRLDTSSRDDFRQMKRIIGPNGRNLKRMDLSQELRKGHVVMAPYQADPNEPLDYFRAKVLSIPMGVPARERVVKVHFIDYGNAADVHARQLVPMPDEMVNFPPLAFECRLVGIGPNLMLDPHGKWTPEATGYVSNEGFNKELRAKVYSVVDGVTALDLTTIADEAWENSCAEELVRLKLAVRVEETYMSKMDNEERLKCIHAKVSQLELYKMKEREIERASEAELMAIDEEKDNLDDLRGNSRSYNRGKHRLQGPYSPLEMKMFSKVKALQGYTVFVENDSVNSVLLDENPSDGHERVLVAAQVGAPNNRQRVSARNATLMPSIPGMSSILTLIFAPRAEFRYDKKRERLTGAICGLGFERNTSHSLYEAHDMEIAFDTEINLVDVLHINKMRYWLNTVLGAYTYDAHGAAPVVERLREVSRRVLKLLFELLRKPREDVTPAPSFTFQWNQIPEEHILRSDLQENRYDTLIPLLDGIKLIP